MNEKRNQRDIFTEKLKNFLSDDMLSASADLIAAKHGIKKVARMEAPDLESFKKTAKELEAHDLTTVCSGEKLLGSYNLYIAKDKKMAMRARELDPSFKIINQGKAFEDIIGDVIDFSRLLSYPDCCINEYINNTVKNVPLTASRAFRRVPFKISFLFNNLLNGASNHYLSFHFPCFFGCRKTLDYQKRIFDAIRRHSPSFASEIEIYLRHPFLVFLKPSLGNMYVSWDNRMGFIFDGKASGRELFYSRILTFKTDYPDYAGNPKDVREFRLISTQINRGNRVVFKDDGFQIFRSQSLLYKFKNSEGLFAYFFNFI